MQETKCPLYTDQNLAIYPTSIQIGADTVRIALRVPEELDENLPSELEITGLPSLYEATGPADCREKIGRLFARELLRYLGSRYTQTRRMAPSFGKAVDCVRLHSSLTGCILVLVDGIPSTLLRRMTPFLCQIVRRRYSRWAGVSQFFPNGYLYVSWLVGRLVLGGVDGKDGRLVLAQALQKLVLLNPSIEHW